MSKKDRSSIAEQYLRLDGKPIIFLGDDLSENDY